MLHFCHRFGLWINNDNVDATSKRFLFNTVHIQHMIWWHQCKLSTVTASWEKQLTAANNRWISTVDKFAVGIFNAHKAIRPYYWTTNNWTFLAKWSCILWYAHRCAHSCLLKKLHHFIQVTWLVITKVQSESFQLSGWLYSAVTTTHVLSMGTAHLLGQFYFSSSSVVSCACSVHVLAMHTFNVRAS